MLNSFKIISEFNKISTACFPDVFRQFCLIIEQFKTDMVDVSVFRSVNAKNLMSCLNVKSTSNSNTARDYVTRKPFIEAE